MFSSLFFFYICVCFLVSPAHLNAGERGYDGLCVWEVALQNTEVDLVLFVHVWVFLYVCLFMCVSCCCCFSPLLFFVIYGNERERKEKGTNKQM